jgi:hypothetical protein
VKGGIVDFIGKRPNRGQARGILMEILEPIVRRWGVSGGSTTFARLWGPAFRAAFQAFSFGMTHIVTSDFTVPVYVK